MKSLRLMAAVGALIALCAIPYAFAAGLFPGLPIVGQAAYCAGYSLYPTTVTTPGTLPTPNQCNTTAPAGPSALTGVELQPADTTVANGPPATVLVPMAPWGVRRLLRQYRRDEYGQQPWFVSDLDYDPEQHQYVRDGYHDHDCGLVAYVPVVAAQWSASPRGIAKDHHRVHPGCQYHGKFGDLDYRHIAHSLDAFGHRRCRLCVDIQ